MYTFHIHWVLIVHHSVDADTPWPLLHHWVGHPASEESRLLICSCCHEGTYQNGGNSIYNNARVRGNCASTQCFARFVAVKLTIDRPARALERQRQVFVVTCGHPVMSTWWETQRPLLQTLPGINACHQKKYSTPYVTVVKRSGFKYL